MEKILTLLGDNGGNITLSIFIISIFIEISPIKISPITAFFKWLSVKLNGETKEQLRIMSFQLSDISGRINMLEVNDMRSKILDFSNSCLNERKHTKDEFEHVIDLHTQYVETISKYNMKNGRVDLAFKYISDLYARSLQENSFLESNSKL